MSQNPFNNGRPPAVTQPQFNAPPRTQSAPPTAQQNMGPGRGPHLNATAQPFHPRGYPSNQPPMFPQGYQGHYQGDQGSMPQYPYHHHVQHHHHHYGHYHQQHPQYPYGMPPAAPPYASPPAAQQPPSPGAPNPRNQQVSSPSSSTKGSKAIPIVDPKGGNPQQNHAQLMHHHHHHQHHHPMHAGPHHLHHHHHHHAHHQGHPHNHHLVHHHLGGPAPLLPEGEAKSPTSVKGGGSWESGAKTPTASNTPKKSPRSPKLQRTPKSSSSGQQEGVEGKSGAARKLIPAPLVGLEEGEDAPKDIEEQDQALPASPTDASPSRALAQQDSKDMMSSSLQSLKKMYSVEFLLRFQNEQTEPPEKIKLFSEIYMPAGGSSESTTPITRGGQRLPTGRGKGKGSQGGDGREYFGTSKTYGMKQHHHQQQQHLYSFDELDHRVENPYKAVASTDEMTLTIKRVSGILNKLTPEKFAPLSQQMQELKFDVNNQELLSEIIRYVFETAVKQSQWCDIYADLCKDLTQKFAPQPRKDGEENPNQKTVHASFRRALLNRCQTEFETPPVIEVSPSADPQERLEAEKKMKARQLGNIKFIGELFKRRMLTEKIMHEVIKRLLLGTPPKDDHFPSDEEIEVLCKLLKTVGQQLDLPKAQSYMNHYFEKLAKLQQSHPTPRIAFMLQDVLDLREDNWVPRREEQKAQTFSDLENTLMRKELERQESFNREASRNAYSPQYSSQPARGAMTPSSLPMGKGGRPPVAKADDWTSVGARKPTGTSKAQLMSPSQQVLGPASGMGRGMAPGATNWGPGRQDEVKVDNKFAALTPSSKSKKEKKKGTPKAPTTKETSEGRGAPIDDETLESNAISLIEEFKNSTEANDLLDNIHQVGECNYKVYLLRHVGQPGCKNCNGDATTCNGEEESNRDQWLVIAAYDVGRRPSSIAVDSHLVNSDSEVGLLRSPEWS